jgi:2-succinyl-5-enolpyruvyl-6-hydroxy-3-cyclohexene-1-carboxylate synthase
MSVSVCLDERAAAFFASGIARRTREPVMVVTTSGTASLELVPAIAEASLSGLSILAVTADRPARLKGVGAPQTLEQLQAMSSYVRTTISLELVASLSERDLGSIALQLVTELMGGGPVHLNIGIEEPLLGSVSEGESETGLPKAQEREIIGVRRPVRTALAPLDPDLTRELFDPGRKGWLILGGVSQQDQPDVALEETIAGAASTLARRLGWRLAVDSRTQLADDGEGVIHLDLLTRIPLPLPDIAVVIGDFPLARSAMGALRTIVEQGGEVVTLNDRSVVRDPGRFVTAGYVADVSESLHTALNLLPEVVSNQSPNLLRQLDERIDSLVQDFVEAHPDSEIAAARRLYGLLHGAEALFVSASMPIRYLDQFRGYHLDPPLVAMNRGANGIDGVIASYLGFAHLRSETLTALLIGDLATLYDVTALIHLPLAHRGLIVVLDNQGGLIFDQVPPAARIATEVQTEYFVTPPRVRPAGVLSGLGLEVIRVSDANDLDALVERARLGEFLVAVLEGSRAVSHESLGSLYAQIDRQLAKEQMCP